VLAKFELVTANSGGSIVLAGLACNKTLAEIRNLFEDEPTRRRIFKEKCFTSLRRAMRLPRYPVGAKYDALNDVLGETGRKPLSEWRTGGLADLLIVGFDYDTNRATFFRSNHQSKAASTLSKAPSSATLLDAVHASSNAPVLFFDEPTRAGDATAMRRYWDGAIGGYNNPVMAGVVEAIANGAQRREVCILSIGTGTVRRPRRIGNQAAGAVDDLFAGGKPPGIVRDFEKLASSILDDPPDAATFIAHVMLGGDLPAGTEVVSNGRVVRLNPTIRPELDKATGKWAWGKGLRDVEWRALAELAMDAIAADDVSLIRALCAAWMRNQAPNQPIRARDSLEADIGHDSYQAARDAAKGLFGLS
jgi:hypothetical protein